MDTCWQIGSQGDLSSTTTRNWIVPKIRGLEEDPKPQVRMQPRLTEWFQPWKNLSRYPCYTMPDHWPDITGRQYFFQVLHVWEFVPHQDIECSPSEGCHLHIVVGHEDSKAAEVGALAGGAVVSAVPGASTGGPTHDKGHVERTWRQRRIRTRGTPWTCSSIYPKTRICLTILCLSPTLLTLTRGYPRPPFSGKSQLRALVNKSPGHDGSVSIQIPLMAF